MIPTNEDPVYICLCNALTDQQVKQAVRDGALRPRDVYAASGCRAQCGGCTGTVLGIIRDDASTGPMTSAGAWSR